MALREKLKKLKSLEQNKKQPDWEAYRDQWVKSINDLQHTIMDNWFIDYQEQGLMEFDIIPTKRIDPYIGEYLTNNLEITLTNNKSLVIEPVSGITSEFDGKIEFYMRGNINKKVSILRNIINDEKHEWLIVKSYDPQDYLKLNKSQIEKIIDEWLS